MNSQDCVIDGDHEKLGKRVPSNREDGPRLWLGLDANWISRVIGSRVPRPARGEVGSTSVEEVIASLAKVVYRGVGSPAILPVHGPQTLETVSERATLADFAHELWASSPERARERGTQLGTAGGGHK